MKKLAFALAMILAAFISASAALPQEVRWGDEPRDIAKIDSLLTAMQTSGVTDPGKLMVTVSEAFIGTPYVAGTLEGEPETLTINTRALDCTTLVDLAAAIVSAHLDGGTSWTDVANRLREMRYRSGRVDGYPSRHHYVSDWITENTFRGTVQEVTAEAPSARRKPLSLDFMTRHRDKYPALADSAAYARMRSVESGLRGINASYIPKTDINSKATVAFMRDGDIAFITTSIPGLDVTHAGVIVKDAATGVPHLLHASSRAGRVILDSTPLQAYLARNKTVTGIRLVRLKSDASRRG